MSWQLESSRVRAMVWKDLTAERRSKANFNAVVFFAALTLLLFGFATGPDPERQREIAGGILWLTILFSGVLASIDRTNKKSTAAHSMCFCFIPVSADRFF